MKNAVSADPPELKTNRLANGGMVVLSALLTATIFCVDTFGEGHGFVAAVYGLALLLLSERVSRAWLFFAAAAVMLLTLTAFVFWKDYTSVGWLSVVASVAAIAATLTVMLKTSAIREQLLQSNAALERNEKKYRSIFEDSQVALWELDFTRLQSYLDDFRAKGLKEIASRFDEQRDFAATCSDLVLTVQMNQAGRWLLAMTSLNSAGTLRKFLPTDDECFRRIVECLFNGDRRFEGSGKLIRADGTPVSVLIALSFPEDRASLDQVVVAMFDVTQRDMAQRALLAAQSELARASRVSAVGALSASIAHELNQPIGSLVLNAQSCLSWLRRDIPDFQSAKDAAERVVRDGHRAAEILKKTRQLVIQDPIGLEPIDLGELLDETCTLMEHELVGASVVLKTRVPVDLPRMKIAKAELQQVLVNLLSNGIQALSADNAIDRQIRLRCKMDGTAVRLSVRDHGNGVSAENLPKVFDPFFTTKPSGMGIGLSISRSLIEGQGGSLTVKNHSGGGAVFEIRLPVEVCNG